MGEKACEHCLQVVKRFHGRMTLHEDVGDGRGQREINLHFPRCYEEWYKQVWEPLQYRRLLERTKLAGYVN